MVPKIIWQYLGGISSLKISRDGKRCCISDETGLTLFNTEMNTALRYTPHSKFRFGMAPDGTYLIVALEDGTVRMLRDNFELVGEIKLPVWARLVYISADSTKIAIAAGRMVYLFDTRLTLVWSHALPLNAIKIKLDQAGYHLACVDAGNLLTLFDAGGKMCFANMFSANIGNLSLSGTCEYILVSTLDDRIFLMDSSGNTINNPRFQSQIKFAKISGDGSRILVSFPDQICFYTRDFTVLQRSQTTVHMNFFDASDDLNFVVAGAKNGDIFAYHAEGEMWRTNISGELRGVLTTPNGEAVFGYSTAGSIKIDNIGALQRELQVLRKRIEVMKGYGYDISHLENQLKQGESRLNKGDFASIIKTLNNLDKIFATRTPLGKPYVSMLAVTNESFRQNEWTRVLLYLMNTGNAHCTDIRFEYSPNILMKIKPVAILLSGEITRQVIGIKPGFTGIQKINMRVNFWDFEGRSYSTEVVFDLSSGSKYEKYEKPLAVIKHGMWETILKRIQELERQMPGRCPRCGREVSPEWVACPHCMARLKHW